ncbi:MAG TPA: hypothetical protein VF656_04985 [Pyrinomonadaceae bacterium]|jgi:hypothetical protein
MSATDPALELYKVEYEKAVERYLDIYKSIWTNFSYMSIVAGGILTFGSQIFSVKETSILLASIPLFFWYFATYLPLNKYGDQTAERLVEIEAIVNWKFQTQLNHFTKFGLRTESKWGKTPSVRFVLLIFFFLLLVTCGMLGYRVFNESGKWQEYRRFGIAAIAAGSLISIGLIRGAAQVFGSKKTESQVLLLDSTKSETFQIMNVEGLEELFKTKETKEKVVNKMIFVAGTPATSATTTPSKPGTPANIKVENIDWKTMLSLIDQPAAPGTQPAILIYQVEPIEATDTSKGKRAKLTVLSARELKSIHESVLG